MIDSILMVNVSKTTTKTIKKKRELLSALLENVIRVSIVEKSIENSKRNDVCVNR